MLFSIVAAPIYILINSVGGFLFLHTLTSICFCRLFNDGRSDWCEVPPLLCIYQLVMLSIFSYVCWSCVCLFFFLRNVYLDLLPFFFDCGGYFVVEFNELFVIFWKLSSCQLHCLQIFSQIL